MNNRDDDNDNENSTQIKIQINGNSDSKVFRQSIFGTFLYVLICVILIVLAKNIDILGKLVTLRDYLEYISVTLLYITESDVISIYPWEWNKKYIIASKQLINSLYIWLFSTLLPFGIAFILWFIEYAFYQNERKIRLWLFDDIVSFIKGYCLCIILNYSIITIIAARVALPTPNFKDICDFDYSKGECGSTDYETMIDGLISFPNPEMCLMISTSFYTSLFLCNKLIFFVNHHFYQNYYFLFRQTHFWFNENNTNPNGNKNNNKEDIVQSVEFGKGVPSRPSNTTNINNTNNENHNGNSIEQIKSAAAASIELVRKFSQSNDEKQMADIMQQDTDFANGNDNDNDMHNDNDSKHNVNSSENNNNTSKNNNDEKTEVASTISCNCGNGICQWSSMFIENDIAPMSPEFRFGNYWLLSVRAPLIITFGLWPYFVSIFLSICLIHDNFGSPSDLLGSCLICTLFTWYIFDGYWDLPIKCFEFRIVPLELAGIPKKSQFYVTQSKYLYYNKLTRNNNNSNNNNNNRINVANETRIDAVAADTAITTSNVNNDNSSNQGNVENDSNNNNDNQTTKAVFVGPTKSTAI